MIIKDKKHLPSIISSTIITILLMGLAWKVLGAPLIENIKNKQIEQNQVIIQKLDNMSDKIDRLDDRIYHLNGERKNAN